jgi:hypothetical protein
MDTTTMSTRELEYPKLSNTLGRTPSPDDRHHGVPKDWKFWCIIFSLALSVLLTAVEFVSHLFQLGQRVEAQTTLGYKIFHI